MVGKAGLGRRSAKDEDVLPLEEGLDIHMSRLVERLLGVGEFFRTESPLLDPLAAAPYDGSGSADKGQEDGGAHPVRQPDRRLERVLKLHRLVED
jgi:hypothetical protein